MPATRVAPALAAAVLLLVLEPDPVGAQVGGGGGSMVWDSVGVMPDSQIVYIHTRSYERPSETALRVWTRTRSRRTRELYGVEYDRMLLQVEYDCADGALRFIWVNLYLKNRLVESSRAGGRPDPLATESYAGILDRTLCTKTGSDPA